MKLKETEKRLLEAVSKIIEEEGFTQIGINRIAKKAQCDKVLIYRYFGGLDGLFIIRKSKFPQNPKRSVRFSGKRTKRSVQKRKARNTQKAETKVL